MSRYKNYIIFTENSLNKRTNSGLVSFTFQIKKKNVSVHPTRLALHVAFQRQTTVCTSSLDLCAAQESSERCCPVTLSNVTFCHVYFLISLPTHTQTHTEEELSWSFRKPKTQKVQFIHAGAALVLSAMRAFWLQSGLDATNCQIILCAKPKCKSTKKTKQPMLQFHCANDL